MQGGMLLQQAQYLGQLSKLLMHPGLHVTNRHSLVHVPLNAFLAADVVPVRLEAALT